IENLVVPLRHVHRFEDDERGGELDHPSRVSALPNQIPSASGRVCSTTKRTTRASDYEGTSVTSSTSSIDLVFNMLRIIGPAIGRFGRRSPCTNTIHKRGCHGKLTDS